VGACQELAEEVSDSFGCFAGDDIVEGFEPFAAFGFLLGGVVEILMHVCWILGLNLASCDSGLKDYFVS
jgi:hypothetical protein